MTLSWNSWKLGCLSWRFRSIQAQCAFTSGLETFGNLRMTSMTVMAEHHVSWQEWADRLPIAEGNPLGITSNFCYCQHHWSNIDLYKTAGSLWMCSYISQSINKIPNAPSSEWLGNKEVDRPGHQAWNPASNQFAYWISDHSGKELMRELSQCSMCTTKHNLIFKF